MSAETDRRGHYMFAILAIHGVQVMLDRDLAELYGVPDGRDRRDR